MQKLINFEQSKFKIGQTLQNKRHPEIKGEVTELREVTKEDDFYGPDDKPVTGTIAKIRINLESYQFANEESHKIIN